MGATGWISTHRDRTDNQFIISGDPFDPGELQSTNTPGFVDEPWYVDVLNGIASPGRLGDYSAQEVLGGDPISGAVDCVWEHAAWGDQGNQLWNTSGTGADPDGPGVCRTLGTGAADLDLNGAPSHSLTAVDTTPPPFVSDTASAAVKLVSRVLYLWPVRGNLGPAGVLDSVYDPVDDGVPPAFADSAELEWESDYVDLVKVELTGDAIDRSATDADDGIRVALRDEVQPNKAGGGWGTWFKGTPGTWNLARDGRIEFDYVNGATLTWTEVTGLVAGDTGWDDVQVDLDEQPDEVIIFGTVPGMGGTSPTVNTSYAPAYDVAVRITVRSPRYRWVWEGGTNPVTRQYPRDDGRGVSSAPRIHPPTKARRLAGGYM